MARKGRRTGNTRPISAHFFLWTIRKQDQISQILTMNMWSAVSALLAVALTGFVSLEMALQIIFVGGVATGGLIWILVERRRSWLLGISDPKLKAQAHRAMIDYLVKKMHTGTEGRSRMSGSDCGPIA